MSIQMIKGREVTRPSTTPLGSSILDHATVEEIDHFGLANNEGVWASYNCLDPFSPTEVCPSPQRDPKEFDSGTWVPAFEFPVYGGVQCSLVGLDEADQKREIERVFSAVEGRGVERNLLATRFTADTSTVPLWDDPTDITPATDVPLHVAVALLESHAAANYAGVPTLHLPRLAATVLADRLVWEGGKAFTRSGSKVAFGGGYDPVLGDGEEPEPTMTLFATGEVHVQRSEMIKHTGYVLTDGQGAAYGLDDNTAVALVERMYRVTVDCFTAKINTEVWA